MTITALYASRIWPPVRPRAIDGTAGTLDLMYGLGLMARTGATGVHTLLPLGLRVHDRLSAITRQAFEDLGAHTFAAPTLQSRRLWEETGRWDAYQREGALLTVRSSSGEEMCLAPTSEEITAATVREHLRSFRDLPVRLFLNTRKFRDELAPRGGLMRGREFTMADAYTVDTSADTMRESVDFLNNACTAALTGMGLSGVFQAPADGGAISAGPSTEHLVLSGAGQSTIVACNHCGNRGDGAVTPARPAPAPAAPVVNVIGFILTFPDGRIQPAAVAVRSDLQVSARKVAAATGASRVVLLKPQDLPGFFGKEAGTLTPWDAASPDTFLLFDHSAADLDEFAISDGAEGLRTGMNWGGDQHLRALQPLGHDLADAADGSRCTLCPGTHRAVRAVEVAHVFELGTQYSQPLKLTFTDRTGHHATPWMACSGIGITRCMQTVADLHRDQHGLRWKHGTGPADIHLAVLRADQPHMREHADRLVKDLATRGLSCFVDDRPLHAGEKLRYARLLGLPYTAVLSPDRPAQEIEVISRWTGRTTTVTESSHIPPIITGG
ncbi:proline--tRNA ligase [Streptomyces sp. GQFP]|uniref:proline--tRNA ligase n=1 Tax=Streptomyces sp. GQFP TaxID=2907545 RepID=UPI001F25D3B6|nr:aminoacyl--tRNA ligase-related protein [Streptomyces sp. GQFP]UIX34286.1 proline--tRNA ligase [Streptomyces sp. GQFP]